MAKTWPSFRRFMYTWSVVCTCKSLYRRVLLMSKYRPFA
nr:MAG TPA: hypothetical protein [Caudoviricetes sp.]